MTQQYLTNIPVGNEGYVYLIHAEGTTRYKIGRSVNPIARCSDIQKQAPYPLKIISSFWSINSVEDEKRLHKSYASYRVFGEWFELDDNPTVLGLSPIDQVINLFDSSDVNFEIATDALHYLYQQLGIKEDPRYTSLSIYHLYGIATNRHSFLLIEQFVRQTLLTLIQEYTRLPDTDIVDGIPSEVLDSFIRGAVLTFSMATFGGGF